MIASLEEMRLAFEKSGNPFFAWFVLNRCAEANEPIPAWVLDACSLKRRDGRLICGRFSRGFSGSRSKADGATCSIR